MSEPYSWHRPAPCPRCGFMGPHSPVIRDDEHELWAVDCGRDECGIEFCYDPAGKATS